MPMMINVIANIKQSATMIVEYPPGAPGPDESCGWNAGFPHSYEIPWYTPSFNEVFCEEGPVCRSEADSAPADPVGTAWTEWIWHG